MWGVHEVVRLLSQAFVIAVLTWLSEGFRAKPIRYKVLYFVALFGGLVTVNIIGQWLIVAGYKQVLDYAGIALMWFGPVVLFVGIGVREWKYGVALVRERQAPLVGWDDRYDNTERDEMEAVAYGRTRQAMAFITAVLAVAWFCGGVWLFVA